jgi:hypothetical protein
LLVTFLKQTVLILFFFKSVYILPKIAFSFSESLLVSVNQKKALMASTTRSTPTEAMPKAPRAAGAPTVAKTFPATASTAVPAVPWKKKI